MWSKSNFFFGDVNWFESLFDFGDVWKKYEFKLVTLSERLSLKSICLFSSEDAFINESGSDIYS